LIGGDREPELFSIESEGSLLVRHRNANEFDAFDHDEVPVVLGPRGYQGRNGKQRE
jgi:hypothetical protein